MTAAVAGIVIGFLALVAIHDLVQRKHAILRNFPVVGHLRYLIESIGPEIRQYIVAGNHEEAPFSRDQRRWVYSSAKSQNNYFAFGSESRLERETNYVIIRHAAFPYMPASAVDGDTEEYETLHPVPCSRVLGAARGRERAFQPQSIINVSAMSFGSLGARAVEALNRGCALAGALQNTGEGGISPHHLHGAGLIWQLGTGYFGARRPDGGFCLESLCAQVDKHPVRAIEVKLSQGAKPGKGGVLPGEKVTAEIAAIRGIAEGVTCISPPAHPSFRDADSLLDFVETIAQATGLPVGIKAAVGELSFWKDLARLMESGERGVDYIAIDGGEGGTGAAPLVFSDHVAQPFLVGFSQVYRIFAERGVAHRPLWVGAGKLGFPERALLAYSLGCDLVYVAREAMLSIGCIQAQKCHTGHCPTGVATHNWWLQRGLEPGVKSVRLAHYLASFRHEVLMLARACGFAHPAQVTLDRFDLLDGGLRRRSAPEVFAYEEGWGLNPADAPTNISLS